MELAITGRAFEATMVGVVTWRPSGVSICMASYTSNGDAVVAHRGIWKKSKCEHFAA